MKPLRFVIAGVLALTLTGIALPSPAGADPIDDPPPTELVEVSESGSYIVVMEADPLVATVAAAVWFVLLLQFRLAPQLDGGARQPR